MFELNKYIFLILVILFTFFLYNTNLNIFLIREIYSLYKNLYSAYFTNEDATTIEKVKTYYKQQVNKLTVKIHKCLFQLTQIKSFPFLERLDDKYD